ncbi:hypothetical protein FRB99_001621 [Tulasnella sp. 403]|nr:hypothetical protein FRB99_001621 [Tulasnella sp. 403]
MSRQPDSDDEDENEDQRQSDDSDEDPSLVGVHSDNTDDDDNIPGDVASDDEDEDVAAMQQQVAADYYARRDGVFRAAERSGLGTAPRREASSHSSDDWNQEFVPLDANAIVSQPKTPPGVSRFKASLLSQPSVPITAIGPDAREIIKEGKLVDDKLLVPADSESDDGGIGEKGRKIIEELRRRDSDFDQDQAQSIAVLRDPEAGPSMSKGKENAAPSHKPPQRAMGGIMERPLNKRTNGQTPSPSANPGKLSSSLFASNIVASGVASRGPPKPTRPESSSDPQSVDSSQLHATIVDSPSFRPVTRGTQASEQGMTKPSVADTVMARDVLERPPRAKANASTAPPLVSRFKAERM